MSKKATKKAELVNKVFEVTTGCLDTASDMRNYDSYIVTAKDAQGAMDKVMELFVKNTSEYIQEVELIAYLDE